MLGMKYKVLKFRNCLRSFYFVLFFDKIILVFPHNFSTEIQGQ
jgi:hypothetical protein